VETLGTTLPARQILVEETYGFREAYISRERDEAFILAYH